MPKLDPAEAAARREVTRLLADVAPTEPIVLGVSGGADSLALAAVMSFVAPRAGWQATAVVVDHQLQTGSAQVADRAAAQVRALGLAAEVVTVEVGEVGGPEGAARYARRAALSERAAILGAQVICLAHTADDQAETLLLALGRGSGARALAGMSEIAGHYRRPLLGLRRADTERICATRGLDPWHDPHNLDPAYRRVRVRREVLPLLDDVLGGGIVGALNRTSGQIGRDADYLDAVAREWLEVHPDLLLSDLRPIHAAIRSRALRAAAVAAGASDGELASVHVTALELAVIEPSAGRRIELPGGISCFTTRERLSFAPTPVAR